MPGQPWPTLRTYDSDHLQRISLPIGGIGTGTVGLGGRGDLRDFEWGNRPAKGFRPSTAFVAVRAQPADGPALARLAEGPLPIEAYEGGFGSPAAHHGLPRFRDCSFDTAYPFGQVRLADRDFPLQVTVQGFNPFVIADLPTSSLPVAVLRYRLTNPGAAVVQASVALSMSNAVGANGTEDRTGGNHNEYRETDGLAGLVFSAEELPDGAEAAGEFTVAVITDDDLRLSHRTGWADHTWGSSLLDFWDDLLDDGRLDERQTTADRPIGSLAAEVEVPAGAERDVTFLLSWRFPNRLAWSPGSHAGDQRPAVIGNGYAERFADSWQPAADVAARLPELERATVDCVRSVIDTDAPADLREAALFNLSTLRTQTVFQSAAGDYYGWEGTGDTVGSCHGTCTHVWGYEFATSLLFAPIAQSFRRTQYLRSTDTQGLMSFRTGLPVERAQDWRLAAADGQMACLVHLYLDWRLSGDDDWLAELWPTARQTLEFCWITGGWDADADGVMEGVQHNTMDVEYYGPNPQMGSWYLAALRCCQQMAEVVGEHDFAERCADLSRRGSAWLDANLFNGSYYRHQVRPVADPADIAEGLRHDRDGARDTADPDLQIADGCLVDQLVGQYAATLAGLGSLLDDDHVATAWRSVHERNLLRNFEQHFNSMRSFVLGDEGGVLMCSYDPGKRPERPFSYFSEVMTGFEYTAATGLLQTGAVEQGLEIIASTRSRYDGARRNPFDEAECGHHYARAMASWSAFATWNATDYDGRNRTLVIGRPEQRSFWSTGTGYGTWTPGDSGDSGDPGALQVLGGDIAVDTVVLADVRHRVGDRLSAGSVWQPGR